MPDRAPLERAQAQIPDLPTVLLVDDDPEFAEAQTELLQMHGYSVMIADGPTSAEEALRDITPDVALVDLRLKSASGIDVIHRLNEMSPQTTCILLTAFADVDSAIEALRRGASDYLRKPVDPKELLLVLERCLETRRLRDERSQAQIAKQQWEATSRARVEFLSRMSHELRTPMTAILGFAELLQMDQTASKDTSKRWIQNIVDAGDHLLRLVNEVLDLTKIDAGEMNVVLDTVSVRAALESSLSLTEQLAAQRQVTIRRSGSLDVSVVADEQRLKQVLVNLLSNAVKYNGRGGNVSISASTLPGERVRIAISDTGPGIKAEDHEKIFEPFHRLVPVGDRVQGTGVGLSITKRLVELMDGSVGLESALGEGSTFWFELPAGAASDRATREEPRGGDQVQGAAKKDALRVLYVEDNAPARHLVQGLLSQSFECEFLSAEVADEGIEIAQMRQPDVILMDINLPGKDGFEALRELKVDHRTRVIPVIALSANAMPEQVARGRRAGFFDYLSKPIKLDPLVETVRNAVDRLQ